MTASIPRSRNGTKARRDPALASALYRSPRQPHDGGNMRTIATMIIPFLLARPTLAETKSTAETTINFDKFETGKTPTGFSTALTGGGGPVSWMVKEEPSAPSGGKVVAQTSTDQTDYRFPLCVYDSFTAKDVEVSVKFKAVSGKVDQAAG